jgi:excisionase family DNA binding protein
MTTVARAHAVKLEVAAERLSVSLRTIRRMVEDGRLRAIRLGRAVRVPVAEIERVLGGGRA